MCILGLLVPATYGDESGSEPSNAFRRPLPDKLVADIRQEVEKLRRASPLAEDAAAAGRRFITEADFDLKADRLAFSTLHQEHGAALLPLVEKMLRHKKPEVRENALSALSTLTRRDEAKGHPAQNARELLALLLIRAMDDNLAAHRISAAGLAQGFGTSGAPELGRKLARAMADKLCDAAEEQTVRTTAAYYLEKMGHRSLIPRDLLPTLEEGES